ncbi:DUF4403 family protein [Ferruginibacter paludis]|uniref:DUF4403 family protein n=1 Tax=Ferruginibacter paludis TaxID=1310417 RepID=UPI0025B44F4B|nr:DUF4403 family protein [Ferruginibacter paludis]MDN3657861.1 DUF4403 family protein [Ferruginibacter paludis]
MLTKLKSFLQLAISCYALAILMCSCHDNAEAPKEIVTTTEIPVAASSLSIPLLFSNTALGEQIKSKVPVPLKQDNQTIKIPVLNPVTGPVTKFIDVPYKYPCDIIQKVQLKGWKCAACGGVCCLVDQVVHTVCDGTKKVETVVNEEIINKVTLDVPIEYKAILQKISFDGNTNELHVHAVVDFSLKATVDAKVIKTLLASCGVNETMPEIELTYITKLNLLDDGKITQTDKTWGLKWNRPCNLTALEINVEDLMNLPVIKGIIESKINDIVQNKVPNTIDIKAELAKRWDQIGKPIPKQGVGNLALNISELDWQDLNVSDDSIRTEIGAICKPVFHVTDKDPSNTVTPPFPKIVVKKGNDSFNINILGAADFKQINKYAEKILEKFNDDINKWYLTIDGVRLYQHKDSLVVEVMLDKPFKGKIYLWGKPSIDVQSGIVSLADLDLTVESKALLGKLAKWVLDNGTVEKLVKKKFQYPYKGKIAEAIAEFGDINREISPGVFLTAKLHEVKPLQIVISDDALQFVANISGQAYVQLK